MAAIGGDVSRVLVGGGQMGALMRALDWSATRGGAGPALAAEPADRGQHPARVEVPHDDRLGPAVHPLLQRRLPAHPRRQQASLPGQARAGGVPRDLATIGPLFAERDARETRSGSTTCWCRSIGTATSRSATSPSRTAPSGTSAARWAASPSRWRRRRPGWCTSAGCARCASWRRARPTRRRSAGLAGCGRGAGRQRRRTSPSRCSTPSTARARRPPCVASTGPPSRSERAAPGAPVAPARPRRAPCWSTTSAARFGVRRAGDVARARRRGALVLPIARPGAPRRLRRAAWWASARAGPWTTATATSSSWSAEQVADRRWPTPAPTRRSAGAPRRWPSSTAPRRPSSATSATSSARR